jgi:hypothetical protein
MERVGDAAIEVCSIPKLRRLAPLDVVEPPLLRVFAQLTSARLNVLEPCELVPDAGHVTVVDLQGHTPSELAPVNLLHHFGIELDDTDVVMAVSDTYVAWATLPTTTGLALTRAHRRLYLYRGSIERWVDSLRVEVASTVTPDLIICVEQRWAVGLDNDTGEVGAVARW